MIGLACLTISTGLVTGAPGAQLIVVALGASNTAGYGVGAASAYPAQLESMLKARGVDARVVNAGISGDTTGGMLARMESAVVMGTQIVLLDPARNDFVRHGVIDAGPQRRQEYAANVSAIQSRLRARGIKVIVIYPYRDYAGMKQPDGIHLTAEAHRLLAARLVPQVIGAARSH